MLKKIQTYASMIKFSHTIFALPFALSTIVLASYKNKISFLKVFLIILAMFFARSSAMGFNRIVDSKIDAKNPRTCNREIPKNKITKKDSIYFVLIFSICFILICYLLGELCFKLSFFLLLILFTYSFSKRFTILSHIYLGFAIGLCPVATWIALTNSFSFPIVLFSLALLTYIAGFDIIYSCQDVEFDKNEGLHSIPAKLGIEKALKISSMLHITSFVFFLSIYFFFNVKYIYLLTILLTGLLFVIEHKIIKPDKLDKIHISFFHINSIISVVLFIGIFLDKIYR